jgi:hypothetical protein
MPRDYLSANQQYPSYGKILLVARDQAMGANYGGIDLTPAKMDLKTFGTGNGIQFHLDPATLKQLQNALGFTPVIISIQPLKDLSRFLELS